MRIIQVTGFANSHIPTEAELREAEINAGLPRNLKMGDRVYSTQTRQRGTVIGWNTLRRTPSQKAADADAGKFYVLAQFNMKCINILVAKPPEYNGQDFLSDYPGGWNHGDAVFSTIATTWADGDKIEVGDKGIMAGAGADETSVYVHFKNAKIDQDARFLSTEPPPREQQQRTQAPRRSQSVRPRNSFHDESWDQFHREISVRLNECRSGDLND